MLIGLSLPLLPNLSPAPFQNCLNVCAGAILAQASRTRRLKCFPTHPSWQCAGAVRLPLRLARPLRPAHMTLRRPNEGLTYIVFPMRDLINPSLQCATLRFSHMHCVPFVLAGPAYVTFAQGLGWSECGTSVLRSPCHLAVHSQASVAERGYPPPLVPKHCACSPALSILSSVLGRCHGTILVEDVLRDMDLSLCRGRVCLGCFLLDKVSVKPPGWFGLGSTTTAH